MTDIENDKPVSDGQTSPGSEAITPSWKPLWWTLGIVITLAGLGEFALEFVLDILELIGELLENIYLVLVEAPEEILEDYIEEWLQEHFPQDASRYSEMVTAIGLTPLKLLVGLILLRNLWRYGREHGFPRAGRWFKRHYQSVRLAIRLLAWPYKVLALVILSGLLLMLI
jgi:H+/Cl- antiporter ClcA